MAKPDTVLIWSFEHNQWWRANSRGYTSDRSEAGKYARSTAEEIVLAANYGGTLNEEIVELHDMKDRRR